MKTSKIQRLQIRVRSVDGGGLFHDSREDVRRITKVLHELITKVNELVDEVNQLKQQADNN